MLEHIGEVANSPFIVPVAGCAMILGMSVASGWAEVQKRRVQSQERLAAIASGVPIPPTPEELAITHGKPTQSMVRRRANLRLAASILLASSAGLIAFFFFLSWILHERDVLCGAAAAIIPLAIGLGIWWDVAQQDKDIAKATENIVPNFGD
ncbi:MAG: hypothetical protein PW735_08505 [Acidobacteriaceae bacterium]|nr:hypothetical protein [Acidobacteriaceae bacterium]